MYTINGVSACHESSQNKAKHTQINLPVGWFVQKTQAVFGVFC